ncbi:MAG: hypothetical protein RIQ49_2645 [Pseudomonadota bacterium]
MNCLLGLSALSVIGVHDEHERAVRLEGFKGGIGPWGDARIQSIFLVQMLFRAY